MKSIIDLLKKISCTLDGHEIKYFGVKLKINDDFMKRLVVFALIAQAFSSRKFLEFPDGFVDNVDEIYRKIRQNKEFNKVIREIQIAINSL